MCASKPAENNKNSGLNCFILVKTFSYAFKYTSDVVPASNGIFNTLLNFPFSLCEPEPG